MSDLNSEKSLNNEVNRQFLRRTPVKLRQFSRLLNDILIQKVDPLRVKALLSQVNKTRESCTAQGFESTAKLLKQLFTQLSLSDDSLDTQKPLLKRLAVKLQEHSEKLELGVRPQKEQSAPNLSTEKQVLAETAEPILETKEESAKVEATIAEVPVAESNLAESTPAQPNDPELSQSQNQTFEQKTSQPTIKESQTESQEKPQAEPVLDTAKEQVKQAVIEEVLDEDDSIDSTLHELGIYLDKGAIVFVAEENATNHPLSPQIEALGIDVHQVSSLAEAKQYAVDNAGSIIVAPLTFAHQNEQLDDVEIETNRIPLIFTAEEDDQADRLMALRSGGTGYLVEPVSISSLLELIETQYDLHADSPYRVLIMEDSKAQAKFYDKVLAKGHFETRVVNDPSVFFEALRGFDPEVILMDMQMPGCSGIELTRIVRQMPRYSHIPIIFLSAEESARKQNQALMAGGTSFVVKPPAKEQLMFLVELYAKRHRSLNPQIGLNPDTGLAFSPQFKQLLSVEASRMSRNNGHSAFAIIQLDEIATLIKNANYSLINVATQQLALLLKQRLRKSDVLGHLEPGQLGIVLTSGSAQDWFVILNEVRLHFAELPFHLQQQDKELTISIGYSELAVNGDTHQWFEQTQGYLNQAIEAGGDQVQPASQ
jgi:PleD family two-component response regulator